LTNGDPDRNEDNTQLNASFLILASGEEVWLGRYNRTFWTLRKGEPDPLPFIPTMSANMYAAQQTNAGDINPAPTVSSSYTQVKDLHISGGLEIRFPSKATIDTRVYQCEKAKIAGGVFLAGESDDVDNVLKNPAVRAMGVHAESLSSSKTFLSLLCANANQKAKSNNSGRSDSASDKSTSRRY
jgi:hypothetical protein